MTAYIFDLGNVVVRFDHRRACRQLAALSRKALTEEAVFEAVFASGLEGDYDRGLVDTPAFIAQLRSVLDLQADDARIGEAWANIFWPNDDVVSVVHGLGDGPLVLASNTNALHFEWVLRHYPEALAPFERRVLSYQAGVRKPAVAFYERCLEQAGTPAGECVYVDDRADYVQVARAMGMAGIVYAPGLDLLAALQAAWP